MHVYHLGKEQVEAYLRDATLRFPLVFAPAQRRPAPAPGPALVTLGHSGNERLNFWIERLNPPLPHDYLWLQAKADGDGVRFRTERGALDGEDLRRTLAARKVLLLDSSVHSGRSLSTVHRALADAGAENAFTYSLTVKTGSAMLPTAWGLMIGDADRCYFLLDQLPGGRLMWEAGEAGQPLKPCTRPCHLVDPAHLPPAAGKPWSQWLARLPVSEPPRRTLVLVERGTPLGAMTFRQEEHALVVEAIRVRPPLAAEEASQQTPGVRDRLLRAAETLARFGGAAELRAWTHRDRLPGFLGLGFSEVVDVSPPKGIAAVLVRRGLLKHLPESQEL